MLKIGVVTTLSGAKEHIGRGILASVRFGWRKASGGEVPFEIVAADDRGGAYDAIAATQHCMDEGCSLIIGPADSDSMHAVLQEDRFRSVPILVTLATSTDLANQNARNFFRLTTPNRTRAELLLLQIAKMYPGATVEVYVSEGSEQSYSQSLKRDVVSVAHELGISIRVHDFSSGRVRCAKPPRAAPILICAASATAVILLAHFRSKGCTNQAFSFGSNTNFLTEVAVGTVVACDLDRNDANPKIKGWLEEFDAHYPDEKDPSLPSMNAGFVAHQLVARHGIPQGDITRYREELLTLLHSETFDGLLGPMRFSPKGELLGFEQITLSRISRIKRGFGFVAIRAAERPLKSKQWTTLQIASAIISVIGAITGVVGAVQYFFPH